MTISRIVLTCLTCTCFLLSHSQVYKPRRFDILINEIMADPSPTVGLPNAEFIELKNRSGRNLQLQGWRIANQTSKGILPYFILPADSFVLLTSKSAVSALAMFGTVLGITNFPTLDNHSGLLSISSEDGVTIHAVPYNTNWFQNTIKANGGWTLELIDPDSPCGGATNWSASTDARGGTPGMKNSADRSNKDIIVPRLLRTFSPDSHTIIAYFDEPIDSLSASGQAFQLSNYHGTITALPQAPLFNKVVLHLSIPMQQKVVHLLSAMAVKDCVGNIIGAANQSSVGVAELSVPGDIVINEILFHPRTGGDDYVELYNKSNKVLDVSQHLIANRNASQTLAPPKKLSEDVFSFFPGDYLVITENAALLQREYFVRYPSQLLEIPSLPSLPNDKGTIIIINSVGEIIDDVTYSESWQFSLITNPAGVAMERINAYGPSSDKNNWHSASSTSGYGTPTFKNSQNKEGTINHIKIEILPRIFTPDNDSHDDFAIIQYNLEDIGFVANINIFDANGRPVRYLVKNELCGRSGSWKWDGLDEKKRELSSGFYIIHIELFNLSGKKKQMRQAVVLERRD